MAFRPSSARRERFGTPGPCCQRCAGVVHESAFRKALYSPVPQQPLGSCGCARDEIESAACECRDLWRIGQAAIPDLALAIEGAGVILIREITGVAQIEGL